MLGRDPSLSSYFIQLYVPLHPLRVPLFFQVFIAWAIIPSYNLISASQPPHSFSPSPSHPPHMTREREVSPRETSQSQPSLFFPSTNPQSNLYPHPPLPTLLFYPLVTVVWEMMVMHFAFLLRTHYLQQRLCQPAVIWLTGGPLADEEGLRHS